MLLSEYQTQLAAIIDRSARTDLVVVSELANDARTPKVGVVKGTIEFIDGTLLFFNEYLDCRYRLEKLSYAYHCQDARGNLVFRYDNAAHTPALPFGEHKHVPSGEVVAAEAPELEAVLEEIMERFVP